MMMKGNEMIRIGIDISAEDYEFNWKWLGSYINRGMRITHYTHVGPGGGNPYVELEFSDITLVKEFAEEYDGTEGEEMFEDFLQTHEV